LSAAAQPTNPTFNTLSQTPGHQEGDSDDQQHPPFVLDARVAAGACLSGLVSCAVDVGGVAWGSLHVGIYFLVVGFGLVSWRGGRLACWHVLLA
jgi:hypothetical protein